MEIGKEDTITATTANGYTFVGWFDGDELLTNSFEYKFIMPETSQVYTAKWIKVSIEKNIEEAGTVSELNSKYIFGEEVSITSTTNDGYTWLGWYEGENLVSSNLNPTFKMPDKNTTFTAKWETKQYNITLNLQGGSLDGEPVTSIALGETKNLGVPSKTDYVFGGWFTLDGTEIADADGNMLSGWSILDNTEIFAKWLRTLSFNSNGGDFVESLFVEPGTVVDLITPKKTGHSFDGWSINTEIYKDSFEMPDSNVELTANWTANNYYIYYNGTSLKVTYGQYYSIPTPTRNGYIFRYFTLSSSSSTRFSQSGIYNIAGNTSLSCKWIIDLTQTVTGNKTITASRGYLENGMTFTITYSGKSMKYFAIETNVPVNVTFVGTGYSYSNRESCGVNSHNGDTEMVIVITIPSIDSMNGTFSLKFTCDTKIHSGTGY